MIGETILHYKITEQLGRGGMGVVYKALDLTLNRTVALKFLPNDVANNSRMLLRLKREARAASALNHPNICTIYAIEEFERRPFIAMEFLEGCTVKERLNGSPVGWRQAIDWALQILEALEAAHEKGIVHRDIKLGNLFLTLSGRLKVLDFGLAKMSSSDDESEGKLTTRLAEDLTQPGTAIGTIPYMSPEQVRGDEIDARSDLFSFGVVLYEMIAGVRPFDGKSAGIIFDRVLNAQPPSVDRIVRDCPQGLADLLETLMQKDPAFRYQSAAETKQALLKIRANPESAPGRDWKRTVRVVARLGLAPVAVTFLVGGYVAWVTSRQPKAPDISHAVFTQLTNEFGPELFPVLSRDGKSFIYASARLGNWDIFLQRVGGQNATNLTQDSSADDTQPAMSPDEQLIAFRSERDHGGTFVMGATGESVRRLSDFGYNPTWSPDGKEIALAAETIIDDPNNRAGFSSLWAVEVATGKRRLITGSDAMQPSWSPHGYRIAYWASRAGQRDIWTIRPDGSDVVRVTNDTALSWNPVWSPDGTYLYFSSDRGGITNLWRISIDEKTGNTAGSPEAITTGGGLSQRAYASLSADGRKLAYVEQFATENIRRIQFDPVSGKTFGEPEVVSEVSATVTVPDVSPDGDWLTFQSYGTQEDIYLVKRDGSGQRQLTNDIYKDRVPRFSFDGQRIAFYSNRSGSYEIWTINADGSGLEQITNDGNHTRSVWSPDGMRLAGFQSARGSFILDLATRGREVLPAMTGPTIFGVWSWSPDGQWLAGRKQIASSGEIKGIALYNIATREYEDLTSEGSLPVWLADNERLIFVRSGELAIIDRKSRKVMTLDAFRPDGMHELGRGGISLPKNDRFIYFTVRTRQADVWLMSLP